MNLNTWNYLKRKMIAAVGAAIGNSFSVITLILNGDVTFGAPESANIPFVIDRDGYTGAVEVVFTNVPAGVTLPGVTIAAGESSAISAFNYDGTTAAGSYTITGTFTGGSIVKVVEYELTVTP